MDTLEYQPVFTIVYNFLVEYALEEDRSSCFINTGFKNHYCAVKLLCLDTIEKNFDEFKKLYEVLPSDDLLYSVLLNTLDCVNMGRVIVIIAFGAYVTKLLYAKTQDKEQINLTARYISEIIYSKYRQKTTLAIAQATGYQETKLIIMEEASRFCGRLIRLGVSLIGFLAVRELVKGFL